MFRGLRGRTVLVNLTDGSALKGTVVKDGWWILRLSRFEVLTDHRPATPADGVARIPLAHVVWIQELTDGL